jgi:aspartate carbamoyltransferase catalytic subunit
VMRHASAGTPFLLSQKVSTPIINAGDGMHAHPSQALLDMMTVREVKGRLDGLRLAIVGDISHSRVARSDIIGFTKMGAEVRIAGPPTMMPAGIDALGASVTYDFDEAIDGVDVIMMLRIQKERQRSFLFPTEREYSRRYGLTFERLKKAKSDVMIMHPGPLNRGVEISPDVADSVGSAILDQVTNGVALRMALLYLVAGGMRHADDH